MKRIISITFAIIILATAYTAGAHQISAQRVIANIPFAFIANNKTLPAGNYTITVLNSSSDKKALQIRSINGRFSAMVLTNAVIGKISDNAKLVFERYDDRYFFSQAQLLATQQVSPRRIQTKTTNARLPQQKRRASS